MFMGHPTLFEALAGVLGESRVKEVGPPPPPFKTFAVGWKVKGKAWPGTDTLIMT